MSSILRKAVVLVALAFAGGAAAHGDTHAAAVTPKAAAVAGVRAQSLTVALLDLATRYNTAAAAEKGLLLAALVQAAQDRHDELARLTATDPAEVLRVALPAEVIARMPPGIAQLLEQAADESGDLEVLHVDHVNTAEDYYLHVLTTAKGRRYTLHFAGAVPELASGLKVRVRGVRIDDAIVLASAGDVMVTKAVAVLGNTLGAQKTLAILVNFSDAPTAQPYTPAQAQGVVFTTTSNYDLEASYQQTWLTGDVAGWFTIAETTAACNYTNIAAQAKQAAANAGYTLANYSRFVFIFPSNTCSWWGLGTVGGNPSQAWVQAKYGLTLGVVGHEMGHNFGLYHSHSLDCGAAAYAASGCTTSEYGDVLDLMGNSSGAHFNAYHKERLGWLNAGVSPPLTTVVAGSAATTYTIAPLSNARDGTPRALKIPRGTACTASNEWYYVEARQAKGFDSVFSGNTNVLTGVLVHKVTDGSVDSSYLLDMTPATASWSDAALVAGQAYVDPVTGVTIKPTSVTATGAQVTVSYPTGTCTRSAPKIAFTPTATVWTSAGATTTYSVTLTSQDSCGCAATAYDVAADVPAGWSGTTARTASIGPGTVTTAAVTVGVAAGATAGFYTVNLSGANASAATLVASAPATVAIASALAVSARTSAATYTLPKSGNATITVPITSTVTSSGAAVAGTTVTVVVSDPSGRGTTLTGTTDSNGAAVVNFTLRAKSTKGTYTVRSTATMGTLTGAGAASFVVN